MDFTASALALVGESGVECKQCGKRWGKVLIKCGKEQMFIGEYTHNIDDKGRLAIPSKFRTKLGRGAVITKGLDGCLWLYPMDSWKKIAPKLAKLSPTQGRNRAFARLMLAGAMDVAMDKQGRVNLPVYLRQYAALKGGVVLAGLFDRIEVWDEKAWQSYRNKTEKASDEIAEQISDLGI